jgi:hypothetical protein
MRTGRMAAMLCALSMALLVSACGFGIIQGSGNIQSETRDVSDFTGVDFAGSGEVNIVQGETEGLTIEADDNLLPYITSTVLRGTLRIGFDNRGALQIPRPSRPIRYTVNVRNLNALEMSGAGEVYAEQLTADSLAVTQSGAGKMTVDNLTVDELAVELSGAGNVILSGRATDQTVELSGFGSYEAGNLQSQRANIELSGAGSATVWVQEMLNAELSGAGSVRYYGSPQINSETSGLGSVDSLGAK